MSTELGFTLNDIKYYLISNGGRVEYHELVKSFRHFLSDPNTQNEARNAFKDYVNRLATVCTQQNTKYLVLRPEFLDQMQENVPKVQPIVPKVVPIEDNLLKRTESLNRVGLPLVREAPIGLPLVENRRKHPSNHEMRSNESVPQVVRQRSESSGAHFPMSPSRQFSFNQHYSDDNGSDIPPQPPPRRRNSAAGAKSKLELRLNGEKYPKETPIDSPSHQIEKLKEIHELSTKTPGRVKERAQKIDKMASLAELKPPMPSNITTTPAGRPKSRTGTFRDSEETDSGSVQTLDPLRRKWIISASNCDYNSLVLCLKEEPKLSAYKDFTNGYTALHWAAKFAKPEIVKLIAGTYGVSPNLKTHGGYTPLHLAAIHKNELIMDLLIKTYQADPNIRDNSGKKPAQYLANKANPKKVLGKHTNGLITTQPRISSESSTSFIRIGSLKAASKVKKITGIGPKSWGSVESISENNVTKKSKKNKKNSKRFPTPERRDSDSDSAYGFH